MQARLVGVGAAWAAGVALPAVLLAQVADAAGGGDGRSPLVYPCVLLALAGMAVGGWAVGREDLPDALATGAVASLAAIVVVQALGILRQVIGGHDVSWATLPVVLAVAAGLGAAGAHLGRRWPGRTRP